MSAIRAFIAIDFPSEIHQRLDHLTGELRSRLPDVSIRWVPGMNIHLTLKFLGDVSTTNLEMLYAIVRSEAEKHPVFEIGVGELGAFPTIKRPRVIWVGVEAPAELSALQGGIENETTRLGYAPERRPFSPHLTVGRVSRNVTSNQVHQISDVLSDCKVGFLGATRVESVNLYRSDLQPSGAKYTRLYSAELIQ